MTGRIYWERSRVDLQWSKEKPTAPGWWWVWQPAEVWPCRGKVQCVEVYYEASPLRPGLHGTVPGMEYSDPLTEETWDDALWLGPIPQPEAPKP